MKTSQLITVCAAAALMRGVYVLGYKDGMRGEDAPVLASVQAAEGGHVEGQVWKHCIQRPWIRVA